MHHFIHMCECLCGVIRRANRVGVPKYHVFDYERRRYRPPTAHHDDISLRFEQQAAKGGRLVISYTSITAVAGECTNHLSSLLGYALLVGPYRG